MIHHLELRFPEPSVLPADPVQRFLCYVLEDAADELWCSPRFRTAHAASFSRYAFGVR